MNSFCQSAIKVDEIKSKIRISISSYSLFHVLFLFSLSDCNCIMPREKNKGSDIYGVPFILEIHCWVI